MMEDGEQPFSDDEQPVEGENESSRMYEFRWKLMKEEENSLYSVAPILNKRGAMVAVGADEIPHVLQMSTEAEVDEYGMLRGIVDEIPLPTDFTKAHTDSLTVVVVSEDHRLVAIGGVDGRVSIYTIDGGQLRLTKVHEDCAAEVESLTFAKNSRALLGTFNDGSCVVWNATEGMVSFFAGHKGRVINGFFVKMSCGMRCVTAGADGMVCVWDPRNGAASARISACYVDNSLTAEQLSSPDPPNGITSVDILEDASLLACGCATGSVVLINYESGSIVKKLPQVDGVVEVVKFSPSVCRPHLNDHYIAAGDEAGYVHCAPISNDHWRTVIKPSYEGNGVTHLTWTPRETDVKLVAGAVNGSIRIYECRNGELVDELAGCNSLTDLRVVNWVSDLACVVACTDEGEVAVWQLD